MQVKGLCVAVAILGAFSVGFGEENQNIPESSPSIEKPVKPVDDDKVYPESNVDYTEKQSGTVEPTVPNNREDDYLNSTIQSKVKNNTLSEDPKGDEKTKSSSESEKRKPSLEAISIKLLEAEENGIEFSDITLKKQFNFKNRTSMKVFSIDFHIKKKLLFYAAEDKIFRELYTSRFSTGNAEVMEDKGVDGPVSIAVDWVNDRLYWLSIRHNTVACTSLNGTDTTLMIDSLVGTLYPNNIAVDPYEGFIFFVSNHSIYKASLDGKYLSDIQLNATEGRTVVKHIALDTRQKRIFYTGKYGHYSTGQPYLASCDYHGQHVQELPIGTNLWNDIFSLAVFRSTLYFAHYPKKGADTVWSVDLTETPLNPKLVYSIESSKGGMWSIKVFHPAVQEQP